MGKIKKDEGLPVSSSSAGWREELLLGVQTLAEEFEAGLHGQLETPHRKWNEAGLEVKKE